MPQVGRRTTTPALLELPVLPELVETLLRILPAGMALLFPPSAKSGSTGFRVARLNAAAQQQLGNPAALPATFPQFFAPAEQAGLLAFLESALAATVPAHYAVAFNAGYLDLTAEPCGELLLVSFTPRTTAADAPGPEAGPPSQQHGLALRQEERNLLNAILQQNVVGMGYYEGENLRIVAANQLICEMWGYEREEVLGRPLMEALPELEGQGFEELLQGVIHTRMPHVGREYPADLRRGKKIETCYFDFIYLPIYDAERQVTGVLNIAVEVTEQVLSRRRVQSLNDELENINQLMRLANAELSRKNNDLLLIGEELRTLNQGLEARVVDRTSQLEELLRRTRLQQEQILLQQALQQQVMSHVPASIATFAGPEHKCLFFNQNYLELSGYRAQLGMPAAHGYPGEQSLDFIAQLDAVYQTGEPQLGIEKPVYLWEPVSGEPVLRYVDFVYQPMIGPAGGITGVLAFILDVTDKVLAHQAIESGAQQLRLIADALPVLISYVDNQEVYQFVNKAYGEWFQVEPRQLVGRSVQEVLGPQGYQTAAVHIRQALAGVQVTFETRFPKGPDSVRDISITYVPNIVDDEVLGFYALVFDITEQVKVRDLALQANDMLSLRNNELTDLNQQLTRTNVDLDNFIYSASHDLKAPITNIEGLLHVLQGILSTREGVEFAPVLTMMYESVDRFKRTISYLSDVIKLQKEHDEPHTMLELEPVLLDVRQDLSALINATKTRLTIDLGECPKVRFSAKNLRSLLFNLLSNAIKYHHPNRRPEVQLQCRLDGHFTVIAVRDNGLGLTPEQTKDVFTMFRRMHTHVEGSGLGLYMVKRSVENAGGHLEVASTPGEGSCFTVFLPFE